jgi:hypothetical protein
MKARLQLNKHTEDMKQQYGHHITTYPQISIQKKGSFYRIEFLIGKSDLDESNSNMVPLFLLTIDEFKEESNTKKTIRNFKIKNSSVFSSNVLFQVTFQEKTKGNFGYKDCFVSLIGDLSKKYSGVKFIFETKNEISDKDLDFIWKIYKTANEPSDVNIRQREAKREYASNSQSQVSDYSCAKSCSNKHFRPN